MDLSRTVSEIDGDISRKSQNFPTFLYFTTSLNGFTLELGNRAGVKKLEWWGYRARKKFDDIFSHVDRMRQRDRRTDGHRATAKTALTHSVAR